MSKSKFSYRDVSTLLQSFRNFLLGRDHVIHGRFPPKMASRTIPPPDIPRGTDLKYSEQYYFKRNAFDSVKPPVVAPVAKSKGNACKDKLPTPGATWWWDGHSYYECTPDQPKAKK
ncbi:uncharacterized protein [Battus philenor]|uniref:uncharacterized protein n=1 Tax=Battus philenor TaxID=42288 RepID=UPI0035D0848B